MRRKQSISFDERVKENIRSIKEDQQLLEQIDERIDRRHNARIRQIPS